MNGNNDHHSMPYIISTLHCRHQRNSQFHSRDGDTFHEIDRLQWKMRTYMKFHEIFAFSFITACSKLHKVQFLAMSVTFCLCMKYLRNRLTDLRQIHSEDVFGPSLGRVWMSGQRSRWPRTKQALFSPLVACMQLMFRKTSLALVCEGFWTFINMFLYWLCCSLCTTP